MSARATFRFGPFRLDDQGLWQGRTRVPLPPKETALLRLLVQGGGRVVSKADILDRLWPDEAVGEASITRCVRGLRKALREGGRRGGTIETVHGHGYRLAAEVSREPASGEPGVAGAVRVGVAPFEIADNEPDFEFLGSGLAGDVTDALAKRRAEGLTVVARQAARRLAPGTPDLLRGARRLRLDYLVTGRLRLEAEDLLVQVELVRVSDEGLLWAEAFRSAADGLSQLPTAIVETLARELARAAALPGPARAPRGRAIDPKSYLALLQGQFSAQGRSERGVRRGIELFERAIAWDPDHAEAHAALADAHLMLGFWGYEAPLAIAPRVRALLRRALVLDPRDPLALAALAYLRCTIDFDPAGGMRAVEQGLAVAPGHSRCEWMRGQLHMIEGRFDEAIAAYRAALDTDPFSPTWSNALIFTLLAAERAEEALAAARELTERDPEYAMGHALRATAALSAGRPAEALRSAGIAEGAARSNPVALAGAAWVFAGAGERARAGAIRAALEARATRRYVGPSSLAVAAVGMSDREAAIAWLERGLAERCMLLCLARVDPHLAPLRGDPRFERIAAIASGRDGPTPAARSAAGAEPRAAAPAGGRPARSLGRR